MRIRVASQTINDNNKGRPVAVRYTLPINYSY